MLMIIGTTTEETIVVAELIQSNIYHGIALTQIRTLIQYPALLVISEMRARRRQTKHREGCLTQLPRSFCPTTSHVLSSPD